MLQYIGKESVPRELHFIQTLTCRSYLFRDIMANIGRTRTSLSVLNYVPSVPDVPYLPGTLLYMGARGYHN